MTATAFIFIFISLLLHSLWHFLCKSSGKASITFFAIFSTALFFTVSSIGVWSGLLFKIPWHIYKFAMLGAFFGIVHEVGLIWAYRNSDISLAYPMTRALPVLFTFVMTALLGWGKTLSLWATGGMLLIFIGCFSMSFSGGSLHESWQNKIIAIRKGLLGIMIAAIGTSGYTIADSFGIRSIMEFAGNTNRILTAAAYSTCREITAAVVLWSIAAFFGSRIGEKGSCRELIKTPQPYLAGVFAGLAYLLILMAMNYVSNVSFVQAFQQLSLPVSAVLGFVILKEKVTILRIISLALIMAGLIMCVIK